jgi:hypothetical protein
MNQLIPLLDFLSGKKTYLIALVAILYIVGGKYLNLWPVDGEALAGLGALALAFLRAGIAKAGASIAAEQEQGASSMSKISEPPKGGTPNTLVPLLALGCIVIAIAMGCSGCVTRPVVTTGADGSSVTNLVKGPDIARISRLSGTAAQLGSLAWLSKNPNDRSYFATANEALKGLINSGNYDPAAFASALQGLPIKELKGSEGSLYISVAIVVWDEAIQSAQGLDRQELVAATLKAVQQGIQRTLDATAPKAGLRRGDFETGRLGDSGSEISNLRFEMGTMMPRWRPALQPAEAYALVTFRN